MEWLKQNAGALFQILDKSMKHSVTVYELTIMKTWAIAEVGGKGAGTKKKKKKKKKMMMMMIMMMMMAMTAMTIEAAAQAK